MDSISGSLEDSMIARTYQPARSTCIFSQKISQMGSAVNISCSINYLLDK
jgi:hypothetical protein